MKKSLITAVLIASYAAGSAAAADGKINFTGKLTDETCELETGTNPIDVQLGTYSVGSVAGVGTKTTAKDFSIKLKNCPASVQGQNVYAKFSGQRDTTNSALLAIATGAAAATGVGIELGDMASNVVPLDSTSPATTFLIAADGTGELEYTARYVSTAALPTAGDANSVADFDIMYP